jgi:transcriptional regulator with XRE-family HTH domain
MVIGNRLKELRESKQLSQGDIEKRTGLLMSFMFSAFIGKRGVE